MANVKPVEYEGKADLGQFITRPEDLAGKILQWKAAGYHVLSPAIQVSSFAPGYGVNASFVLLDPTVDDKGRGLDVYYDKRTMAVTERAPSKIGLSRLAAAAGVSWVGAQSGRRDPLTIQHFWIYQVVGVYLAFDGTPQTFQGEKEIDYRDGSAQIGDWSREAFAELLKRDPKATHLNGWGESRVRQARMNGAERAETGAWERAMRAGFGIKHVYSIAELQQPFVCLRFSPLVDMSDPTVRALVTAGQIAGVAALYAGTTRRLTAGPADIIDISSARRPEPAGALRTAGVPRGAETYPGEGTQGAPSSSAAPVGAAEKTSHLHTHPTSAPSVPPPTPPPGPKSETPQVELPASGVTPANFVKAVNPKAVPYGKSNPKHGQTFTKYVVVDGNGEEHVTIRSALGKKAIEARDAQTPVVIVSAMNAYREREISDITPFDSAQPSLPTEGEL